MPAEVVPALGLPRVILQPVDQRAVTVLSGLPEEDAHRRPRIDRFGIDPLDGTGGGGYFTALMVRVRVPDGTLTVTLSPFFLPTSARPTGESTEMRPADGSLSTAPTRWYVSLSPSLSTTSMVEPGSATLE